jgi:hypothetical protein
MLQPKGKKDESLATKRIDVHKGNMLAGETKGGTAKHQLEQ